MSSGALQYEIFTIAQGCWEHMLKPYPHIWAGRTQGFLFIYFFKIIKVVEIIALYKTEMSQKHIQEDKKGQTEINLKIAVHGSKATHSSGYHTDLWRTFLPWTLIRKSYDIVS